MRLVWYGCELGAASALKGTRKLYTPSDVQLGNNFLLELRGWHGQDVPGVLP